MGFSFIVVDCMYTSRPFYTSREYYTRVPQIILGAQEHNLQLNK